MVDPIVSKVPAKSIDSVGGDDGATGVKNGESKFDKVRARLQEQQAESMHMPPEVKQVSPEQTKTLQAELNQRVQKAGTTSAPELYGGDLSRLKARIDTLTSRVNSLPKTPGMDPLRQRLTAIDDQFQAAGKLVQSLNGQQSPVDLMKVQMQMYQMSENLELMSKVVEQVTSGMKSVLQTQL